MKKYGVAATSIITFRKVLPKCRSSSLEPTRRFFLTDNLCDMNWLLDLLKTFNQNFKEEKYRHIYSKIFWPFCKWEGKKSWFSPIRQGCGVTHEFCDGVGIKAIDHQVHVPACQFCIGDFECRPEGPVALPNPLKEEFSWGTYFNLGWLYIARPNRVGQWTGFICMKPPISEGRYQRELTGSGILFIFRSSMWTVVGNDETGIHSPSLVPCPPPICVNDQLSSKRLPQAISCWREMTEASGGARSKFAIKPNINV